MAAPTGWLIDTSAAVRLAEVDDADLWLGRLNRGLVRVATVTLLELGWTARSGESLRRERTQGLTSQMPVEHVDPRCEGRAAEVQQLLADGGQHRGPSPADLLVAVVAEARRLTVLHVDRDYELIAEVTGQPVERLVLRS